MITEFDLGGRTSGNQDQDDPDFPRDQSDQKQLEDYQKYFPVLWEHPAVEGITLWGWRLGGWRPGRQMNLVREDGSERPTLTWLRQYVEGTLSSTEEEEPCGIIV